MSHNNQQPGIYYLVTCFQDESEGGASNLYCYTNILEIAWAWIILISGSIVLFKRYQKHKDITRYNRKQIIVSIMVINICAYLAYQWSYESALLYFPEYYFQYIFFCYTIYYFGRKSIILGMLNMRMDVSYQDIDPIIQLKLSKLFCIGLCSFFTIIFIMNYIQYFFVVNSVGDYDLCSASFFNIVTTVGFFMQGLFILQVKQLSRQVSKNLSAQKLDNPMMKLKEQIQKNQSSLWILVIFCFFGSFANFMQNVYFVSMIANYKNKDGQFTCWYVNLNSTIWTNGINALIGTTIKFFDFFLPYFLTVKIFWYNSKKSEQQQFEITNSDQNEVEVYELQLPNNQSQQTSSQHTQEEQ
ncbi:unnamed protein product [Paramecium pentaurelia]|uniref:Uncharacterized protein n=1 Tax=Paramecium pentaurelia TaxID=43138 RepID=A0A8S1X3U8_9CILI|nr:unnamed protein product [Paramecium pentaurelia]